MSPDDTLPCPASVPPGEDANEREERAMVAHAAYLKSFGQIAPSDTCAWEELPEYERKAWRAAADAAYHHLVIVPSERKP